MNFDFSDDQKAIKSEARRFLEARCPIAKARAVLDDPAKSYDAEVWKEVAGQGWLGTAIPEAFLTAVMEVLNQQVEGSGSLGFPLMKIKVSVLGGEFSETESNDLAFRRAAAEYPQRASCTAPPAFQRAAVSRWEFWSASFSPCS